MMLVKNYISKSKIHGIGLFAGEPIKKGKLIWEWKKGFDFTIKEKDFKKFPESAKRWVLHYGYLDKSKTEGKRKYFICADDARFWNHSKKPNTGDDKTGMKTIAIKDIKKGEELTCDYFDFDTDAEIKLRILDWR